MSTAIQNYTPPEMWHGAELDLIKQQVAKDCSDIELAYFFKVCQQTQLNPFARQIYAIKRGKDSKMSIQTGIDGYRLAADRSGNYAGSDDAEFDAETAANPTWAKVTVWKMVQGQRVPFTAKARWSEYHVKSGDKQNLWDKMPYLMLGKCAEALALRKAFPAELSGTYTQEEMDQADYTDAGPVVVTAHKASVKATPDKPFVVTPDPGIKERMQRVVDLCKERNVSKEQLEAYMSEQSLSKNKVTDLDTCIAWLALSSLDDTPTDDVPTFN